VEQKKKKKFIRYQKKEEIDICPFRKAEKKGYQIINHKIEIDGICNDCIDN